MPRLIRVVLFVPFALIACGGDAPEAKTPPAAASPVATGKYASVNMDSLGRAAYANCATCHQANGLGLPGLLSPLAGSEIVLGDPEIPIAIILHGMQGPVTVKGTVYRGLMISWGGTLDDVQIAALATYIRSQWGNAAPPVSPELVAKVRAATASRTTMWTWDELQNASF